MKMSGCKYIKILKQNVLATDFRSKGRIIPFLEKSAVGRKLYQIKIKADEQWKLCFPFTRMAFFLCSRFRHYYCVN